MNGAEPVEWMPALVVLAIGVAAGAAMAWRALRSASRGASAASSARNRDLAGKRDALVRQLQELDDTAAKRTPAQLARERYALELDAARALLALEETVGRALPAPPAQGAVTAPAAPSSPPPPALRGFFWGVGSATAVLALAFFVYQSAKPREAGGSVTGNLPPGEAASSPAPDPGEAQLKAAVASNPDDIDARLELARISLDRHEYMAAWNETAKVLERSPKNPRALAYQAVVRLAMGQTDVAADLLKKAVAAEPGLYEGRIYLAVAYARQGRLPAARSVISEAKRRFPERAGELASLLADLEKEGAAPPAAAGPDNPHARLATPGGAAAASTPPARATAGKERRVAGTIDLEPSLKASLAPGGVLFVFVRNAHAAGGPPIAVKRLPAVFPATFELAQADSMMGQEFPERVLVEARLDADGDPTTRAPTDPRARLDDVKAGSTQLRLVLQRP